ncbi:hypothetical protein BH23CHL2_BH23CHL2_10390 [soil metagenome]
MTRNSLFKLISITAVLMLLIAACGDDDDDADATATSPSAGGAPTETRDTGDSGGGENGEDSELAAMGEQLYAEQGCQACHSIDGSQSIGPTWQGLWQHEVPLEDGSTVTADEAYITESIREPNAKVHEGFQEGLMPPYPDMSDENIEAIIAFIQTLSE